MNFGTTKTAAILWDNGTEKEKQTRCCAEIREAKFVHKDVSPKYH